MNQYKQYFRHRHDTAFYVSAVFTTSSIIRERRPKIMGRLKEMVAYIVETWEGKQLSEMAT